MFFFESGPIMTPFMPKASMPLIVPRYMSSQICAHPIIAVNLGQILERPIIFFLRGITVHALRNDTANLGVLDQ